MKTQSMLLAALAYAPAALAHTVFTDFYVNSMPQGDAVAMRMNPSLQSAGSPIASLDSEDMACNVGGTKGVSRVQSVPDGALLTFEIRSWPDDITKEPLDRGHRGPCAVYLKKVDSAIKDKGAGNGWFKIFEHGYDSSTKRWCTDDIIDNKGLLSVNLPQGLEGGPYLARPEILALHAANSGDPQFYTGCAQIFLQSNGDLGPAETVSIPGYVKYGQPATSFDIYNTDNSKYTLPGPPIAKLEHKSAAQASTESALTQSEGLKPDGCLVENGNWCGVEVPSYTDEKGCWASGENCWSQSKVCYSSAPPTGSAGCELWVKKCNDIQSACNSKNFNGPPNKGKALGAEKKKIDVGLIMGKSDPQIVDSPAKQSPSPAPAPQSSASPENSPAKQSPTPAPDSPYDNDKNKNKNTNKDNVPASSASPSPSPSPSLSTSSPTNNDNHEDDTDDDNDNEDEDTDDNDEDEDKDNKNNKNNSSPPPSSSLQTLTQAQSQPTPIPNPSSPCPSGWKCITEIEVVTQTIYVTAPYPSSPSPSPSPKNATNDDENKYKRGANGVRQRRWGHVARAVTQCRLGCGEDE